MIHLQALQGLAEPFAGEGVGLVDPFVQGPVI